jgi:hypothetical protein
MSSGWWISVEWAEMDDQPILPTSTNPCITRADGTQGVKFANFCENLETDM